MLRMPLDCWNLTSLDRYSIVSKGWFNQGFPLRSLPKRGFGRPTLRLSILRAFHVTLHGVQWKFSRGRQRLLSLWHQIRACAVAFVSQFSAAPPCATVAVDHFQYVSDPCQIVQYPHTHWLPLKGKAVGP